MIQAKFIPLHTVQKLDPIRLATLGMSVDILRLSVEKFLDAIFTMFRTLARKFENHMGKDLCNVNC